MTYVDGALKVSTSYRGEWSQKCKNWGSRIRNMGTLQQELSPSSDHRKQLIVIEMKIATHKSSRV